MRSGGGGGGACPRRSLGLSLAEAAWPKPPGLRRAHCLPSQYCSLVPRSAHRAPRFRAPPRRRHTRATRLRLHPLLLHLVPAASTAALPASALAIAASALAQELAARRIAHVCNTTGDGSPKIIVEKSTVPVKTADAMASVMAASCTTTNFQVLSNPEFLAEGTAMEDLFKPDRVLVGGAETPAGHAAVQCLANVYRRCVVVRSLST